MQSWNKNSIWNLTRVKSLLDVMGHHDGFCGTSGEKHSGKSCERQVKHSLVASPYNTMPKKWYEWRDLITDG